MNEINARVDNRKQIVLDGYDLRTILNLPLHLRTGISILRMKNICKQSVKNGDRKTS